MQYGVKKKRPTIKAIQIISLMQYLECAEVNYTKKESPFMDVVLNLTEMQSLIWKTPNVLTFKQR